MTMSEEVTALRRWVTLVGQHSEALRAAFGSVVEGDPAPQVADADFRRIDQLRARAEDARGAYMRLVGRPIP